MALYLNVFVLIVQAFQKVPALKAIAPTQSEPPFLFTQIVALVVFVTLAIVSAIRFRVEPIPASILQRDLRCLSKSGPWTATKSSVTTSKEAAK